MTSTALRALLDKVFQLTRENAALRTKVDHAYFVITKWAGTATVDKQIRGLLTDLIAALSSDPPKET